MYYYEQGMRKNARIGKASDVGLWKTLRHFESRNDSLIDRQRQTPEGGRL